MVSFEALFCKSVSPYPLQTAHLKKKIGNRFFDYFLKKYTILLPTVAKIVYLFQKKLQKFEIVYFSTRRDQQHLAARCKAASEEQQNVYLGQNYSKF